jgi:hypothetical protein
VNTAVVADRQTASARQLGVTTIELRTLPTRTTLTSPRQTRTGNNSKHRKNSQMTDPTHNNAVNTKATFPDEYDETSSFISLYMDNTPGMYAKYSQTTELCNQTPQIVNERLTEDIIMEHLHADHQSDLIAVPTVNLEDNTGRFVMIEIRESEDDSGEPIAVESDFEGSLFSMHDQAVHIYYMLRLNGIAPILCESPRGVYQIWVVLDKPMPASQLIRFGDTILDCCRHRMPAYNRFLYLTKNCTFYGHTSCRDILTNNISIEVHPSSQHLHSKTTNDFVPLPCIREDSFYYMEDGYSELDYLGQRIFMGGLDTSDNYFELHLNSPSELNPKHFVYEPVMTSVEFNQGQFAKSGKPIDEVLSRLKGVQPCENGHEACCPAHIDFTRSLLVSEHETGDVHLYCSKGCSLGYILKSLDPFTRDWLLHVDGPGQ